MIKKKLLSIKNLSIKFKIENQAEKVALNNISLDIYENETVGIIGSSGCGKTVLSLALLGFIAQNGILVGGEVFYKSKNIFDMRKSELAKYRKNELSAIFQIPQESFDPLLTMKKQLLEALNSKYTKESKLIKHEIIVKALKSVSLNPNDVLYKYPFELSGGTLQRIAICMSLFSESSMLIADEITSSLDSINQKRIIELLVKEKLEKRFSLIFITHDLGIALNFCDRIVVMDQGEIIEEGHASAILKNPKTDYTKSLLESYSKSLGTQDVPV